VFGDLGDVPSAVAYHSEWNPISMRGEREARFLSRLRDKVHLARIPNYQKGAGIKLSSQLGLWLGLWLGSVFVSLTLTGNILAPRNLPRQERWIPVKALVFIFHNKHPIWLLLGAKWEHALSSRICSTLVCFHRILQYFLFHALMHFLTSLLTFFDLIIVIQW
jgi:hypothetical protein